MLSKIYPNGNKWIIYYLFLYKNYRTVITLKFNHVYDILILVKNKGNRYDTNKTIHKNL